MHRTAQYVKVDTNSLLAIRAKHSPFLDAVCIVLMGVAIIYANNVRILISMPKMVYAIVNQ